MFLSIGLNNKITDALRLMNISNAPRNYCDYLKKEMVEAKEKIKLMGLEVICMGHSHPNKFHLRKPSKSDWQYLPRKYPQMIVFSDERKISAWKLKKLTITL